MDLAKSGEAVKAGPIGLAVILLMCIACYFLFKSMSKHMRNVRENFPAETVATMSNSTTPQATRHRDTPTASESTARDTDPQGSGPA